MKKAIILFLITALLPTTVWAKAYFAPKEEMVRRSELIAIVTISEVTPVETRGRTWDYRERASANVERVLKGKVGQTIDLYGGETFICAQVRFQPGRHLLFLSRDGDKWVGCNWHLSVRPIIKEGVAWYQENSGIQLAEQPLTKVIADIQSMLTAR